MANSNNDVRELEDLLTELEGQGALPVGPYSDEDDAVTQLMDAPLGAEEWMVQITPLDRRMMSTEQLLAELATGNLVKRDMLVWRTGMSDWAPINRIEELAGSGVMDVPALADRRAPAPPPPPAPLPPPPTPVPPARVGSSTLASPGALPPPPVSTARPATPGTPYGAPPSLTPVPDAPPPAPLPLLDSAFGSPGAPPPPPAPVPPPPPAPPGAASGESLPELGSAFNVPPPAAAPQPPPVPATARPSTSRPVAVDFSEIEPSRPAPMRMLVGSGVAAVAMMIGTVWALSAGGVFDSKEPAAHVQAEPASAAMAAAPAAKVEPKAPEAPAAKPAEPAAAAVAEPPRPSDEPQNQPASAREELVAAPEPQEAPKEARDDEKPAEAERASDEPEEEASAPARTRSERRQARRQQKRTSDDRPAPARRTKPRAAAAAPAAAEEGAAESPKATSVDPPGSTFNRQAAKAALDDAAAQARNCRPQGGPSGSGKVQVRYEPTGKVGAVSILTPQFDNTTTGSCVVMVFRRASIPAFTGSPPVVMNKTFEIP